MTSQGSTLVKNVVPFRCFKNRKKNIILFNCDFIIKEYFKCLMCISVFQQSDGVYGSLIVNQPQPLEPHASLYDFDRSEEHALIIALKFSQLLTGNLEDLSIIRPTSLTINGDEESFKYVFTIISTYIL